MRKNMFDRSEIHCGRCHYYGKPKLNPLHVVILFILASLGIYEILSFSMMMIVSIPALMGLARWIIRDENVYSCPQCGNVNYDRGNL